MTAKPPKGRSGRHWTRPATTQLANFTVIVDVNRLGQRGPTELGWDLETYARRAEAFGARAITIDGHNLENIDRALTAARETRVPTVILAKTIKGRGFSEIEDQEGWHGRALPPEMAQRALAELDDIAELTVTGPEPALRQCRTPAPRAAGETSAPRRPRYALGDKVATRAAYGAALLALGAANPRVVALDGEVSNSTGAAEFAHHYPDRYFEMFIAEQQLVASAVGLRVRQFIPFASTFAAFLTRAHDFIRMAAVSQANICLVGSHAGVEIGPDGPSQMALEDLAMMRSIHGATVLYPSDATSAAALVDLMAGAEGIRYLRTTRGAYPVLYEPTATFTVGGSHTLRSSNDDQVTLIGAGVTVHQCLAAAESLHRDGISARVIDVYSIKPIDRDTLVDAVRDTRGRLVIAEDHRPEGGLGSAVLEALVGKDTPPLRLAHLAVRIMPGSGTPSELLAAAAIDAASIDSAARHLLDGTDRQSDRQDASTPTAQRTIGGAHVNRIVHVLIGDLPTVGDVAIKTSALFLTAAILFRFTERRTLAEFAPFDWIAAVAAGAIVGRAATATDTAWLAATTALLCLLAAHAVLARLRLIPALCRFIDPPLMVLISDGEVNRRNLRRCGLTAADLEAVLREHGHPNADGIHLAILEAKGAISVLGADMAVKPRARC